MLFKYWKQKAIINKQKELIAKQEDFITHQQNMIDILFKEIARRDQTIIEQIQQKGSKNPDPLNFEFPGTEKYFSDFWDKLQKL